MRVGNASAFYLMLQAAAVASGLADLCSGQTCAILEEHRLTHPNGTQNPWFGRFIDASGAWAIAGVPDYGTAPTFRPGAAYMLHDAAGGWDVAQQIIAPGAGHGDKFGWVVAIDGQWAAIGAPSDDHSGLANAGSVQIYRLDQAQWTHHSTLTGNGVPPAPGMGEQFGHAVAICDEWLLVGAPFDSTLDFIRGAVYAFEFDGTQWVQRQKLYAPDADLYQRFGQMIQMDADAAVVSRNSAWGGLSAPPNAYVFRRNSRSWSFEQLLTADNITTSSFGSALAIQGDHIIVGAPYQDGGAAFAYRFIRGSWSLIQEIIMPFDPELGATFGVAVALAGDQLFVGAPTYDVTYSFPTYQTEPYDGAGKVFGLAFDGDEWQPAPTRQPEYYDNPLMLPAPAGFQLGWGLAVRDATVLAGAPFPSGESPMVLAFETELPDCNADGVADQCEPDCNLNSLSDACELLRASTVDCNRNAIPDECEGGLTYANEDGDGKLMVGQIYNADLIWLNQFTVKPGGEYITHIQLVWNSYVQEGLTGAVMLYRDPNNDGNPNDAVYLTSRPITSHGAFGMNFERFTIEAVERTWVGSVGDKFFAGAVMSVPTAGYVTVAANPPNGNWTPATWRTLTPAGQANIVNLSANPLSQSNGGRYMLRALSLDCNGNGTWDQCDIDSGMSVDVNLNGIPDECEQQPCPADISNDGSVDVNDLLAVINHWGDGLGSPADINGDGFVDFSDMLAVLNVWGPCP